MKQLITLRVNGVNENLLIEPWWSLAYVLREELNLIGTKIGSTPFTPEANRINNEKNIAYFFTAKPFCIFSILL